MRDDGRNPNRGGAMLPACKLYDRTSGKGTSYLMGRLGGLRVLVLPKRDAEAGDYTHTLLLAEAPQRKGDLPGADLLAAALARADLSPKARAFLLDVQRQAARRPLTLRQLQAVERIATTAPRADFAAVNRAALARLPDVLARLLPGGRALGAEWHAGSLRGEAGDSLRVRLRGERAGAWCDFATGDKGGDPVSLAAAVARVPQAEAARRLARMLGMEGCGNG